MKAQISLIPLKTLNILHEIWLKNPNRLVFAHADIIAINIDVLLISEMKLNASFPSSQLLPGGHTPVYILDKTQHGGGIMLFIRKAIPSKLLNSVNTVGEIGNLLVEINLRSKNSLLHVLTTHI